jgi:hypothetical protein
MNHSILVELARALSLQDFESRLPDPVLIVLSETEHDEASGDDDTHVGETVTGPPAKGRQDPLATFETLAIRKKRHSVEKDRITLGRERTCDIVVRTPGVSKLHACFLPGTPLRLLDLGSQNGTFVDGKPLRGEEPLALKAGSSLVFGDLATRLATPAQLYAMLKSTVR